MSETQEKLGEWSTGFIALIQWKYPPTMYESDALLGSIGIVKNETTAKASLYFKYGVLPTEWKLIVSEDPINGG